MPLSDEWTDTSHPFIIKAFREVTDKTPELLSALTAACDMNVHDDDSRITRSVIKQKWVYVKVVTNAIDALAAFEHWIPQCSTPNPQACGRIQALHWSTTQQKHNGIQEFKKSKSQEMPPLLVAGCDTTLLMPLQMLDTSVPKFQETMKLADAQAVASSTTASSSWAGSSTEIVPMNKRPDNMLVARHNQQE